MTVGECYECFAVVLLVPSELVSACIDSGQVPVLPHEPALQEVAGGQATSIAIESIVDRTYLKRTYFL